MKGEKIQKILPLGNELMNELYFLNYNFWDIFAVPEASSPLENCEVDNDFCPFMFLYSFSLFFFSLKQWKGNILAFFPQIFLYHTYCLAEGFLQTETVLLLQCACGKHTGAVEGMMGWQPVFSLYCSCAAHPNQPGFLPCCESLIELTKLKPPRSNWN